MTKEEIIQSIEDRIKTEYDKHQSLNWAEISARKVYATLFGDTEIKVKAVCNLCDTDDLKYNGKVVATYCPNCETVKPTR